MPDRWPLLLVVLALVGCGQRTGDALVLVLTLRG